jgi:ABC-type antimicrobial peptide transport system permease subunit
VLLQFLAESVILSVTGGIAGIIVGVLFSEMISIVAAGRRRSRWQPSRAGSCFLPPSASSSDTIRRGRPRASIPSRHYDTNERGPTRIRYRKLRLYTLYPWRFDISAMSYQRSTIHFAPTTISQTPAAATVVTMTAASEAIESRTPSSSR